MNKGSNFKHLFMPALVISNYFSMMHNVDKPNKVDPIFATPPAAEYTSK